LPISRVSKPVSATSLKRRGDVKHGHRRPKRLSGRGLGENDLMLAALFEKDFDRYFAAVGGGRPLWLFVHVPKTAGSSLTAEAASILQPGFNIDIDHTDTTRTYQVKFDASVQAFIDAQAAQKYRFATGHIMTRHVETIRAAVPDLRCFTMLRAPIARLVSDYHYQRSSMNTAQAQFIATTPSLEAYVARPHVHNKIALHLAPRPMALAGDVGACVDHIMANYAFVGLQETYPLSLRVLTTLMGEQRRPHAKVRVNTDIQDRAVPPDLEAHLRTLNAVDIGIFKVFQGKWRMIREDLLEYMKKKAVLFFKKEPKNFYSALGVVSQCLAWVGVPPART
jgi:hypothetical protein